MPRLAADITRFAATLVVPASTYLVGKGYLRLASLVGIPPHTIPCPLCHGSRGFDAFYAGNIGRSADENLFVFTSLFLSNAIPAIVAVAIVGGKLDKLEGWFRRNLTWPRAFAFFAASSALFLIQWLINIYKWTCG